VVTAIVAGIISLLVSVVVAAWTQRKKLESDYDVTLRAERLAEYRKLWALTETLGWYGNHEINPEVTQILVAELDHWYFENGGGILLSDISIEPFEQLLLALHKYNSNVDGLRQLGTNLRYALSFDVGGRNRPLLRNRPPQKESEQKVLIAEQDKRTQSPPNATSPK
jgi:hypothetical protein